MDTETPTPAEATEQKVEKKPRFFPFFRQITKLDHPFEVKKLQERQRRVLIIAGAAALGIFVIFFLISLLTRGGILILEPDTNFKVTLNGRPAQLQQEKNGVLIKTTTGIYRLELQKDSYEPFVADIKVRRGQIIKLRPIFSVLPKSIQQTGGTVDYVRPSIDQTAVFYLGDNRSTIYRLELSKQIQVPITVDPLRGVTDLQWSTNTDLALLSQSDGIYLQEIPQYDFRTQTKVKIGDNDIISPVWDPTDPNRLAFEYAPTDGERSLAFADSHLGGLERKADIRAIPNPKLVWAPDSSAILLIGRSPDYRQNNLWIYTTADGALRQLTNSGEVLDASFAPDSGTILYETYTTNPSNSLSSNLHTIKPNGANDTNLNLAGKVAQSAWKNSSSFYVPDVVNNSLLLYELGGSGQELPFSFPAGSIQGMYFFPSNQTLVFYTNNNIYLSDLAK